MGMLLLIHAGIKVNVSKRAPDVWASRQIGWVVRNRYGINSDDHKDKPYR